MRHVPAAWCTVPQPNPLPWPNHCSPFSFSGGRAPVDLELAGDPVRDVVRDAQIWSKLRCASPPGAGKRDPARWFIQLRFRKAISGHVPERRGRLDLVAVVEAVAEAEELDVDARRSGGDDGSGAPSSEHPRRSG
jgi:hypothetical protein